MASRIKRKQRRKKKLEAWQESKAATSKYAAKKWAEAHGEPPDPKALSKAKAKSD